MPLDAGSKYDNIAKSVDLFVETNIQTGLSVKVYYEYQHVPAAISQPAQWVVATLLGLGQTSGWLAAGSSSHSAMMDYALDFNCYEKSDSGLSEINRYTLINLATSIADIFHATRIIPVYDYDTGGNPQDGGLTVVDMPYPIPRRGLESSGVRQIDVRVSLRHIAVTVAP